MIDHVALNVSDLERSKDFYTRALVPLGYTVFREWNTGAGFGKDHPDFWIHRRGEPASEVHICFRGSDRAAVDAFYEAALAAGGRDNGPPGPRPQYHERYYGAFVLDPDGNNIEAVCHEAG
jgi:catechol 2,3-dioxygenase-like lactoylglutathione lyase family enzyme